MRPAHITRGLVLVLFAAMVCAASLSGLRSAGAADPVVTGVTVKAPSRLTVGTNINLVITVEADSGSQVALATGALPPELSLIKPPSLVTRDRGGGRADLVLTVQVAPFAIGDYTIPPLTLDYRDATGAASQVRTGAVQIAIDSLVPDDATEPKPLKAQAELAATPRPVWQYGAGIAVLAVVSVAVLMLLRRRKAARRRRAAMPVRLEPVPAGPEDRARRELDDKAVVLLQTGDLSAYYAELSTTVRTYLTERFEFPAFALTTAELQAQMVQKGIDRWQARLVAGLLQQCDAVVFAGYRPARDRADSDLTAAYEIVEISRPDEAAPVGANP